MQMMKVEMIKWVDFIKGQAISETYQLQRVYIPIWLMFSDCRNSKLKFCGDFDLKGRSIQVEHCYWFEKWR